MSKHAVRTTIVGGRPDDEETFSLPLSAVEHGLKQSAGSIDFRTQFLKRRSAALEELGHQIDPFDAQMLNEASEGQLMSLVRSVVTRYKRNFNKNR